MPELRVRNLSKRYGQRQVVEDISLTVARGEIIGLLGPNGAGKTTSFHMIVGLIKADGGSILLDDVSITNQPMHQRARAGIGYLPQEASVFRKLSAEDNLRAILELRKDLDKSARNEKLESLLDEFGLQGVRSNLGEQLSGGERRRVEIARALATELKFILLDEPFAGVDPISVREIQEIIRHLTDQDIGVLITDHNVREMLGICHHAYILNEGRVLAEGDAETIMANEDVRKVYLGSEFRL